MIPSGEINRPRESFFPCGCGLFHTKWLAALTDLRESVMFTLTTAQSAVVIFVIAVNAEIRYNIARCEVHSKNEEESAFRAATLGNSRIQVEATN